MLRIMERISSTKSKRKKSIYALKVNADYNKEKGYKSKRNKDKLLIGREERSVAKIRGKNEASTC